MFYYSTVSFVETMCTSSLQGGFRIGSGNAEILYLCAPKSPCEIGGKNNKFEDGKATKILRGLVGQETWNIR